MILESSSIPYDMGDNTYLLGVIVCLISVCLTHGLRDLKWSLNFEDFKFSLIFFNMFDIFRNPLTRAVNFGPV